MVVEHESEPGDPLGILGVDHIGIAVAELDRAVALHTEVLGLRELHREQNPEMEVAEVMLRGGPDGAGATQIQLLAALTPDSPIGRFLDRSGPGLHHVAYRVRNADHAARVLQEKGFRLLYDAAKPGTRGSRINFVHPKDAGGVLIELVEPAVAGAGGPGGSPTPSAPRPSRPSSAPSSTHSTYDREPA